MSIGPVYHAHHVIDHEPQVMSDIHSHTFEEYVAHEPVTGEQNLESAQHRTWVSRGFHDSYDDVVDKAHRERARRHEDYHEHADEESGTKLEPAEALPQYETGFTVLIDTNGNTLVDNDVPKGARRPVTDHEIKRGAFEVYEFQRDRRVAGMLLSALSQPAQQQDA